MKRALLVVVAGCGAATSDPTTPPAVPPNAPANAQPAVADGNVVTTRSFDDAGMRLRIDGDQVRLQDVPFADWIGLPVRGTGSIHVDVHVPVAHGASDLSGADGTIKLACVACQLGDDHARLYASPKDPRSRAFVSDGIEWGHVTLDSVSIALTIAHGALDVTEWTVKSPDAELVVSGHVALAHDLDDSTIEACLRFRPTDSLLRRDPKTYAAIQTTGAPLAADGKYNIRLAGGWGAMKRLGQACDGSQPLAPIADDAPPTRPTLPPAPPATDVNAGSGDLAIDASMIKKIDDTHYELDHTVVERILVNPMAAAKTARFVPAVKDGKPDGFKLYAIRPGSVFDLLGFLNGDTVEAVNGFELSSADKALEVYTKVRDATQLQIGIVRRGKPMTLNYAVR
jgi:hypothetical protein